MERLINVPHPGDFAESAHGYLREMKNGAIFRLLHGCYLIVAYKSMCLTDKWEFTIYSYSFQTCRYMLVLIRLL